ncbi:PepSY domain-containing protein [Pseudoalteromonas sp. T1lg65]|uniref:PepSY domain-containing protein n=1 Tax=Pseudoalteromonas sp. T1lg65 TaxID=2077101 RepID=UPI003F7AE6E3
MRLLLTLPALVLVFAVSGADASNPKKEQTISKKEAVALALDKYSGKTLKISEQGENFIIRILQSDGRVIDLKVNKKTGKVEKD